MNESTPSTPPALPVPGKLPPTAAVVTDEERGILDTYAAAKWSGKQADTFFDRVKEIIARIGLYRTPDGELRPAESTTYAIPTVAQWEERLATMKAEIVRLSEELNQLMQMAEDPRWTGEVQKQTMEHCKTTEAVLKQAMANVKVSETYTERLAEYHATCEWCKDMETWFRAIGLTTAEKKPTVKFYLVKSAPKVKPAPKTQTPVDPSLN